MPRTPSPRKTKTRPGRNSDIEETLLLTRFAMDRAPDSILWVDDQGNLIYANDAACTSMGYTREELLAMKVFDIDPDFPPEGWEQHKRELTRLGRMTFQGRHRTKDGRLFPVEVTINHFEYKDRFVCVAFDRDITERKRAEEVLRESEKKYRRLTDLMTDIVWIQDMNLRTLYVSPSIEAVLGFTPAERAAQTVEEQLTPASMSLVRDILTRELVLEQEGSADPQRTLTLELEYYHKDGSTRWLENIIKGLRDENGILIGLHGDARDITRRRQMEETLKESEKKYRELSMVDSLTQLFNFRHFFDQLKMEGERVNRYGVPLALILLDLDDFKTFNDTHGHVEGDRVLMRLGLVIKRCLRSTDSAYRYGGEEFTILLPMTRSDDGVKIAERIRTEFKKEDLSSVPGEEIHMTLSAGVGQYRAQEDLRDFVNRVDQLMYRAKGEGKDRVCDGS